MLDGTDGLLDMLPIDRFHVSHLSMLLGIQPNKDHRASTLQIAARLPMKTFERRREINEINPLGLQLAWTSYSHITLLGCYHLPSAILTISSGCILVVQSTGTTRRSLLSRHTCRALNHAMFPLNPGVYAMCQWRPRPLQTS